MYYIASPYSHPDAAVREQRYKDVCKFTAQCLKAGIDVFSPIVHSHSLAEYDLPSGWDFWEKVDLPHVKRSEAVIVLTLDGWNASEGVNAEMEIAGKLGIPIVALSQNWGLLYTNKEQAAKELRDIVETLAKSIGGKFKGLAKDLQPPPADEPTTPTDGVNPKDRVGITKPQLDLIPPIADLLESIVLALGAKKYGRWNWRGEKVKATIYVAAIRRHLMQWLDGQDDDAESGVSHLAHVRACASILLDAQHIGRLVDDRSTTGTVTKAIQTLTRTAETAK